MAWVRVDDQAPRNEKMLKAGPAACWLWVCGIAHCQSQLTDGFISSAVLPMIGVAKDYLKLAERLVDARLWDAVDGGFRVHDYLEFNQSRAQVTAKRAEDADRKRKAEEAKKRFGVAHESARSPSGNSLDSVAPRAGVPSHPIPSEKEREHAQPPRRGDGVFAGSLPKDHLRHVHCGRKCVPEFIHAEFIRGIGGDPDEAKSRLLGPRGWYAQVEATLGDGPMGDDPLKFWRAQFAAAFPSTAPKPNGRPEPVFNVPDADKTQEYLRRQRQHS